jgi:hypothetical protein
VTELLDRAPVFINDDGVSDFAGSISAQGFPIVNVDWSPPAGGDSQMADLLDKLL